MKLFKRKKVVTQEIVKEIKVDLTPELKIILEAVDKKFEIMQKEIDALNTKYDRLPQTEKPSEIIIPKMIDGEKRFFNSRGEEVTSR